MATPSPPPKLTRHVTTMVIQVQNVMKGNSRMEEALQRITGHTVAKIHEDFQRDFYLSSAEAVQYGIIDEVLLPREKTRQDLYKERGVRAGGMVVGWWWWWWWWVFGGHWSFGAGLSGRWGPGLALYM